MAAGDRKRRATGKMGERKQWPWRGLGKEPGQEVDDRALFTGAGDGHMSPCSIRGQ